ncbi:MAG TPA: glycosyltransferase family 39 protein, partial [Steroidobacter sp.]|nr:glycosyltransferase family 39 protein [Steroidobacter sp.]
RERTSHRVWFTCLIVAGTIVRFWGLGAVGLHGDEETMAMAVRHIIIDGWPILPSGLFYPRGITQLYMMAASVALFGESEWALRLPSALCGVALIAIGYGAGRRFLRPAWNLAFAASIAFLPVLLADSQTARMYIFLITLVMTSMACIFAWERTDRVRWLVGASVALIVGLDMHVLAVAAVLMFLAPGLLKGDLRTLALGVFAGLAVTLAFFLIDGWVNSHYPTPPPEFANAFQPPSERSLVRRDFGLVLDVALLGAGVAMAVFAWRISRLVSPRQASLGALALLFLAIALQLGLSYHLAALCYLVGVVITLRYGPPQIGWWVAMLIIAAGALAAMHSALLAPAAGTAVRLVGALLGQPSAWPYARLGQLSLVAALLTGALLVGGVYQFARRRSIADYWLLAILGVWAPVFALGAFKWNVPSRYTEMSLAPMLLCAFAAAQGASDWLRRRFGSGRNLWNAAAAAIAAAGVVNPAALGATVDSGYRRHPDHKGAAEFMRSQRLTEDDVVLAEDVLQQTYYLGRVDYWLIGPQVARKFVKRSGSSVVDFYTGTPVIVTTTMLDELLRKSVNRRVYVIGSGEGWSRGRRGVRGELQQAIDSARFHVVYTGRDGLTRVLRAVSAPPPESRAAPSEDGSRKSISDSTAALKTE